jgi:hypothetical protein
MVSFKFHELLKINVYYSQMCVTMQRHCLTLIMIHYKYQLKNLNMKVWNMKFSESMVVVNHDHLCAIMHIARLISFVLCRSPLEY